MAGIRLEIEEAPVSLGKKALVGSIWSSGVNYISQGIGLVSQVVLGRLLLEADFGVFAAINSIIQFVFMLSAFSFNMSMIQAQEEREDLISTAFILTLALSLASMVIAAVSLLIFMQYRTVSGSELWIFSVLAMVNIANLFGQIFDAVLQRRLEFKKIALISVVTNVLNPCVAVALAFSGFGVWSLVWGQAAAAVSFFLGNLLLSRWRIQFRFSVSTARWFLSMGWRFLASRALEVIYTQLDRLVIKSMNSYDQVGLYDKANLASLYPSRVVTPTIINVALPVYSRVNQDTPKLADAYSLVNFFLIRVLAPFALVFLLIPDYFMAGIWGGKWITAAPVLKILALYAFMYPIMENLRVTFYSIGKPEEVARVRLLQIVVYIPALAGLVYWKGIEGAAMALLISIGAALVWFGVKVRRVIDVSFVRLILMPFISSAAVAILYLLLPVPRLENTVVGLFVFSFCIFGAYCLFEMLLERRQIFDRMRYIKDMMRSI